MFAPLAGRRIVDLTRVLAGPFCTQLLGDWGADVIKVERPFVGDDTRHWGPPFDADENAVYFHSINRNKRSLALDFKSAKGRQILEQLVAESDVFVENYIPGKLAEYGMGWDDLKSINPKLVYASLTGWGQTGPLAQRAGYDVIIASYGGLLSITGEADGPPARVGVAVTDLFTGVLTSNAILASLAEVEKTGQGVWIQSSLLQAQASMLSHVAANFVTAGIDGQRRGTSHPSLVPYQSFITKDKKYLTIGAGNDRHFSQMCHLLDLPDLATDARFATNRDRVQNRDELIDIMSGKFAQRDRADWETIFDGNAGFPWGPVNTIGEAFTLPELRDLCISFPETEHREEITVPGTPVNFSLPLEDPRPPPRLGEHSRSILAALNYSAADIDQLAEQKIIQIQ